MRKRNAKDQRFSSFRVAGIGVDPERHRLLFAEREVKLEPKVMAVLVCLAERAPAVVPRNELIVEVWQQTVVSDETVTMAVSKLRRALQDDPRAPRIIETIPKGGYRLMVEVKPWPAEAMVTGPAPLSKSSSGRPSIETPQRWQHLVLAVIGAFLITVGGLALRPRSSPEVATPVLASRPLTALPGREIHPAISPDGRYVAFVHQRDGSSQDLFLRTIDDESLVQLTEDSAIELRPTWSPDGAEIAFVRIEGGRCAMVRRKVLGGQQRRIADCGGSNRPDLAWSPTGEGLAFPDRSGPGRGVGLVWQSLANGQRRFLTDPIDPLIRDSRPVFSPAGDRLAFARRQVDGRSHLFEVSIEGGEARRVTPALEHLWGHAWTSDGQELIYSSLIGETFALWRIRREGGTSRWLPIPGVEIARDPSVAPQTNRLVFESWSYDVNILRFHLGADKAEEPQVVWSSTAWDSAPQLSPDGNTLAFVSSRSGRGELWVSDQDSSTPRQLVTGVRYIESVPRWSPTSDRLAFVTGGSPGSQIAVVKVASGQTVRVGSKTVGGRAPAWSADGQSIYFASTRDGSWQVWKTRLDTGEAAQVTRDGGFAGQESSDGSWLYFTRLEAPGLWRQPVAGGPVEEILSDLESSAWGNWFLADDAVIFARAAASSSTSLMRLDLETRSSHVIATLANRILNPGLTMTPDVQTVWFSRLEQSESDLRWIELD